MLIILLPYLTVTESPNMTVVNISSTALYVNWTMLPLSTDEYQQLLGYKFFYWKESDESQVFNETLSPNENNKLFEDLEKWTVYCFKIAGFTLGGTGPNDTQCARTFEDGMLKTSLPHQRYLFRYIPKGNIALFCIWHYTFLV